MANAPALVSFGFLGYSFSALPKSCAPRFPFSRVDRAWRAGYAGQPMTPAREWFRAIITAYGGINQALFLCFLRGLIHRADLLRTGLTAERRPPTEAGVLLPGVRFLDVLGFIDASPACRSARILWSGRIIRLSADAIEQSAASRKMRGKFPAFRTKAKRA